MQRMGIAPKILGSLGSLVRLFPESTKALRRELGIDFWSFGYFEECRSIRTSLVMLATSIQT